MARASAPAVFPWKYHVFLSFRGEDTRRDFTDHLYKQLEARGIKTFRDEPELKRGTDISSELLRAIDQSMSAIIVLSTNFASSSWCLRELTHIVRCMKEKERIFPIFFGVEPSDVRHQRGSFKEAFAQHEVNYRQHEVIEWRESLERVADLVGWDSKKYGYDTELIQGIVNALWKKVHPTFSMLDSSEGFVGIGSKLEEIDLLLDTGANDVRFIGIRGMGGVGKTTLARLVYERISHDFEGSSFLADVREVCKAHDGIAHLQKQLLSDILRENNIQIWNAYSGIARISRCLCNKKVLLILDDVDQSDQLENLVKQKEWFGLGSRIVITTRNERLLVEHGIEKVYEVKPLTQDEALFLFSRKAFKDDELEEDFLELSKCFISYASGLPLALKTLGSSLYKRGRDEWKSALDKLKQAPDGAIFETLKISYDALNEFEKRIFLDIACFHEFRGKEQIIERLENSGLAGGARIVVEVLIEKSLLSISDSYVHMHDLIQAMAWEIVRRESKDEPGGRSRLWLRNDILHVLAKNTGSEAIEGIVLRLSEFEEAHWNPEAFTKMCKLRLLDFHNVSLSKGPNYLPNALRELKWSWYPSKCLPPTFQPDELTELSLRHGKIDHLWDGIKRLGKLKSIDLSYSHNLTRTPDFTGIQNLEELVLQGCTNLIKIHSSIAFLKRLRLLNLKDCKSVKRLPNKVEMESLEVFDISGCSKVKKIPEFVGEMKNFSRLSLSGTVVQEMPSSVIRRSLEGIDLSRTALRETESSLVSVKNFDLSNFLGSNAPPARSWRSFFTFGEFPAKISHPASVVLASLKDLCFLKKLNLEGCNLCEGAIPDDIGFLSSLENLNLSGNHLVSLPASIGGLSKLRYLNTKNCNLGAIPDDIGFLSSLQNLNLSGNHLVSLPASISGLSKLLNLNLENCNLCEGGIPDDIGFLSSLEELNLSGNHLVSLPASISGLSKLQNLNLENCYLCEGAIPNDIGLLSSLGRLNLSGNHFVSLPASISGLSKLSYFDLENCKRLQQLPAIPLSSDLSIYTDNCFSLAGNQGCNAIMYSMLKRLFQELPHFQKIFDIVIPGSEIPEWFNNHRTHAMARWWGLLYALNL